MTKREKRFMEILSGNMIESALNGHLDLAFELNKSLNTLEFEEDCNEINNQFTADVQAMDKEYELSVAKMRAEHKAEVARIEATGTFKKEEEINISSKLDEMLKSF